MNNFSNLVSNVFADSKTTINFIEKILNSKNKNHLNFDLSKIITVSSWDKKASLNILSFLEEIKPENKTRDFPSYFILNRVNITSKFRRRIIWILGWIDYFTNIFSGKYKEARNYYKIGKLKKQNSKIENLNDYVKDLNKDLKISNIELSVKKIQNNLFNIKIF